MWSGKKMRALGLYSSAPSEEIISSLVFQKIYTAPQSSCSSCKLELQRCRWYHDPERAWGLEIGRGRWAGRDWLLSQVGRYVIYSTVSSEITWPLVTIASYVNISSYPQPHLAMDGATKCDINMRGHLFPLDLTVILSSLDGVAYEKGRNQEPKGKKNKLTQKKPTKQQ